MTAKNSEIKLGGSAFPPSGHGVGMSLRDWFAGQALLGLCESGVEASYAESHIAAVCWRLADAMLDERSKEAIAGPRGASNITSASTPAEFIRAGERAMKEEIALETTTPLPGDPERVEP